MASPDKPRRPWFRPHLSTWVVSAFVALFFCFWNVAGYYREREYFWENSVWIYGWPATYLEREVEWNDFRHPRRVDDGLTWKIWSRVRAFFPGPFLLDLVVGGFTTLFLGSAFEAWRRRRAQLFQIYLSELGILTAIVCGILGGGRYLILSTFAEEQALGSVQERFKFESGIPEFLRQRLPGYALKLGDTVTGFVIYDKLDESQMAIVCRQRGLRKLEINSPLAPNVWQKVLACRRLEEIDIGKESLQDADLGLLPKLPRLKKLNLSLGSVSPAGFRQVGQIKTLNDLTLTEEFFAFVTTENLEQLSELPLTNLNIRFDDSRCGECELTGLGKLKSLRELCIVNKQLTSQDVAALRQLRSLEVLTINDCEFESATDCESLFRTLTNVRTLSLEFDDLPLAACQAISDLSHLESLSIRGRPDSFNEAAARVSRITSLRRIDYYNGSTKSIDDGIAQLVALPHLEHLEFYCDGVTDKAVDSFVQMKALKTLKLTCDHLSPAGTKRLEKERPDLKVTFGMCY
ncbi:MAG: hypothetical protein IAF94_01045 [Pirellulaceae bacterium]|nr:hypothetical protein [Pirellulaceae bacterium]